MFLLPAVASGDPLPWVLALLLGTVAIALRKLIGTLSKVARLELWVWFSKRHGNANKDVKKLIEQSSRQDLLPKRWGEPK
jgi:hypothetical protein